MGIFLPQGVFLGGAFKATFTHPSPPSNPSALVSGAGTPDANGPYTNRGMFNGKPWYVLDGEPTPADPGDNNFSIAWFSQWVIGPFDELYISTDDVAFPWLATWDLGSSGVPPAPTVTHT